MIAEPAIPHSKISEPDPEVRATACSQTIRLTVAPSPEARTSPVSLLLRPAGAVSKCAAHRLLVLLCVIWLTSAPRRGSPWDRHRHSRDCPIGPSIVMLSGFPGAALALRLMKAGQALRHSLRQGRVANLIGYRRGLLEAADCILGLAQGGVDSTQVAQGIGLTTPVADSRAIASPSARAGSASVQRSCAGRASRGRRGSARHRHGRRAAGGEACKHSRKAVSASAQRCCSRRRSPGCTARRLPLPAQECLPARPPGDTESNGLAQAAGFHRPCRCLRPCLLLGRTSAA